MWVGLWLVYTWLGVENRNQNDVGCPASLVTISIYLATHGQDARRLFSLLLPHETPVYAVRVML